MFFPVDVLTVFHPLYDWTYNSYNMTVRVNGERTEIDNMNISIYDKWALEDMDVSWEEFSEKAMALYSTEPEQGDYFFYKNI